MKYLRMELLCFSGLSVEEDKAIRECLEQFDTIFLNPRIEETTIKIRKQYKLKLPDAIIANTALVEGAVLITRNTDDFKRSSERLVAGDRKTAKIRLDNFLFGVTPDLLGSLFVEFRQYGANR